MEFCQSEKVGTLTGNSMSNNVPQNVSVTE